MPATAAHVDAIRALLAGQPRARGVAWITSQLNKPGRVWVLPDIPPESEHVQLALRYLSKTGEVRHTTHHGWHFVPLAVQQRIKQATPA